MQQSGVERGDGGFLAAMLRAGRGKDAADLADQGTLHPQATGLIEEAAHLRGHVAETGRRAENDRIILGEFIDRGDRGLLVELEISGLCNLRRNRFRYALDGDAGTGNGLGTVSNGLSHFLDMTIG